ncbi:MAG: hypothetical protein Q9216_000384 [Gyalolechia sp. 2 TL-2023]
MGRKGYMTRLALGRSAYAPLEINVLPTDSERLQHVPCEELGETARINRPEPGFSPYVQQFDDRGHPENLVSRALSRASRRAQNDLLASLGYLTVSDQSIPSTRVPLKIDNESIGGPLYKETSHDADNGELIAYIYSLTSSLIHYRSTYLRNRLQVESPKRMNTIRAEWANSGPSLLLFGGLAGDFLVRLSAAARPRHLARRSYEDLVLRRVAQVKSTSLRYLLRCSAETIRYWYGKLRRSTARLVTNWTSSFRIYYMTVVATLRFHSILQGLGLKPLQPLLPGITTLVPFTPSSMIQPISMPKNLQIASLMHYLVSLACSPIMLYYALRAAKAVTLWKVSTYLELALPKPDNPDMASIVSALERGDDAETVPGLNFRFDRERRLLVGEAGLVRELAEKDWAACSNGIASMASWCRSIIWKDPSSSISYLSPNVPASRDRPASASSDQVQQVLEETCGTNHEPTEGRLFQSPETALQSQHARSSSWQTTLRDLSGELRSLHDHSRPTHRVTQLTHFMAGTMAAHLSLVLTNALFLPLESLFVRSVASAYLSTTGGASVSSMWIRDEIYPFGSWFGMGLGGGRAMDYARKMTLCLGTEMALVYGFWQVGVGAVWWLGKSEHRWGRL